MKVSIKVDTRLVKEVVELSGERTEETAVEAALREYVRSRRKELLLNLPGAIRLEEDWRELRDAELDD